MTNQVSLEDKVKAALQLKVMFKENGTRDYFMEAFCREFINEHDLNNCAAIKHNLKVMSLKFEEFITNQTQIIDDIFKEVK